MKTKQVKNGLLFYGLLSVFLWPQAVSAVVDKSDDHAYEAQGKHEHGHDEIDRKDHDEDEGNDNHEGHGDHKDHDEHEGKDNHEDHGGHKEHDEHEGKDNHVDHGDHKDHDEHEGKDNHEGHDDHKGHDEDEGEDNHEGHGGHESHVERSEISAELAKKIGITTQIAKGGLLNQTQIVYGTITVDPRRETHIKARFPGLITKVKVKVGDQVRKGQILAEVEANRSLKRYQIRSPFAAMVISRHANSGELTEQNTLFTLANYKQVLAEFKVFPNQMKSVKKGQSVSMISGDKIASGHIDYLLASQEQQPFKLARVTLDNQQGEWTPGLWLTGKISVNEMMVPLLIDNRALQSFEGRMVVFVKNGNYYEPQALALGRQDELFTEVLSGLEVGSQYVVENSYLIKADLEKSSAAHEH